jgi:hypothetical protein
MRYALERTLAIPEITNALAFSPDGALLAVATRDKHASNLLVRLDDGALLAAPRFVRRDLAFAPDGSLFVAGASVQRFDVGGPKVSKARCSIPGHPRGLTRVSLSPNGLWALVTCYLEDVTLWHLGGAAPTARWTTRAVSTERAFFSHDSASLWAMSHDYREGRRWDTLQRGRLRDDGAVEGPDTLPLPEGLSPWDQVLTTPHGLYAVSLEAPALRRLDAETLAPVGDGIDALGGRRDTFAMAPDGACLVAQGYVDPPEGPRQWRLLHVAIPSGRVAVAMELGEVSAGLIAVSPGGERIAYTRSDTDRTLVILRRELA